MPGDFLKELFAGKDVTRGMEGRCGATPAHMHGMSLIQDGKEQCANSPARPTCTLRPRIRHVCACHAAGGPVPYEAQGSAITCVRVTMGERHGKF